MDTIVAISTPLGRSGIGVVRLSGENALEIGRKLVFDEDFSPQPRSAILRKIYEPLSFDVLDEAVLTFYKSPFSFTGEDVLEISCHGSPVLLRKIVDAALQFDARLAEPGEFTLRALANGKLNLSQAEAVRDLIDAQTVSAVRQAAKQLGGELSNQLQPLKDDLLNIIVVLESALEFVEDDLPNFAVENIKNKLLEINKSIGSLAETFRAGRLLREGLKVALVGRPNVGKSSIFNSLIGQERAIVTEIPGTTRDSLRESLSVNGIPISLFDTAGVRESTDKVETIGVERTRRAIADADLVIVVLDGSLPLQDEDFEVLRATEENLRMIAINKTDLNFGFDSTIIPAGDKIVRISAKTGSGLDLLRKELIAPFASQDFENSGFLISDARHYDLLRRAQFEVSESFDLLTMKASEEIVLVGLHNALRLLGEITGETTSEDVLTRIFSTFCIGK
ncbi:MAG: tRNA uridine-5-carboxymethylaminomethyl(34) synthesis GTPase MnmE [Acidobacteriota bacterium]|nr:tRNA uridine-5-carboxymethylaminomethyl(34) synthesis GTPase MnmE [Acidobacteriota bacterium]